VGAQVQHEDDVVAFALEADGQRFASAAASEAVLEGSAVGEEVGELGVPDFALAGGGTCQKIVGVADDEFGEEIQELGGQLLVALESYPHTDINFRLPTPIIHRIGHPSQLPQTCLSLSFSFPHPPFPLCRIR
jgi:hypothetical protein